MIKWSDFRDRIGRALGDTTVTEADHADYINQALTAISAHTAEEKIHTVTLDGNTSTLTLPDDLLAVGPVHVSYGTVENNIYRPIKLMPGTSLPAVQVADMRNKYYYHWGNTLTFLSPILSGRVVNMTYFAYWPVVSADNDILRIPRWMEEPLQWYSLHLAMAKPGAAAARLRQWNTKQDSGTPDHNSLLKYSAYCLSRYNALINEQPMQNRSAWEVGPNG